MILTTKQYNILTRCIGGGPLEKAKIVVFGNELGTAEAGGNLEKTIESFIKTWKTNPVLKLKEGFVPTVTGSLPVNSIFLQNVSRMALAIRHKEPRFFGNLSGEGRAVLNRYITEELYKTETAVINLKPLPQTTERTWEYSNINEKEYQSLYNFTLKRPLSSVWKELRIAVMKEAFERVKDSLILGSGAKYNKKAFLEKVFENIIFEKVTLNDKLEIFVSKYPKIILSNYYSSYSGVGLDGMKQIYFYLINNNMV